MVAFADADEVRDLIRAGRATQRWLDDLEAPRWARPSALAWLIAVLTAPHRYRPSVRASLAGTTALRRVSPAVTAWQAYGWRAAA